MTSCVPKLNVAFVVQGLFEISDSIGFDCVYQFRIAKTAMEGREGLGSIRLFAERSVAANYPDVQIESMEAFYTWSKAHPDGIVVYHYCGEWKEFDQHLMERKSPSVIRWHNNTPPWFYMEGNVSNALHTIAGFENIVELLRCPHLFFWVNSEFTTRQFLGLGGKPDRVSVVYPASRYLYKSSRDDGSNSNSSLAEDSFDILFVGRVVHHKGYRGLVSVAARLQELTGLPARLHLPGRVDTTMRNQLSALAEERQVDARLYGEVTEIELARLYREADVFLCLSEHEGFGLPVFEAMSCSVPVVAWATTAFEHLLKGHPLAFPQYDLNLFVAAILALRNEDVRTSVLEAQNTIVGRYNHSVLTDQLATAFQTVKAGKNIASLTNAFPQALRQNSDLAEMIAAETLKSRLSFAADAPQHDSGDNLYSLYDLRIYRDFLDAQTAERRDVLKDQSPDPNVLLHANEFSWREGSLDNAVLTVSFDSEIPNHVVFGPYVQLPAGDFSAQYIFTARGERQVTMVADVAVGGVLLAERAFSVSAANLKQGFTVQFSNATDAAVFEFRLRPKDGGRGTIQFCGVRIRRKN
ncbi:glycosyltransferase family 4 protein [Ensifer adhaerens]|uniref:glycosyltransferase family 4 protein n=1 Tax=Ensifer adhaerens TaxID=106592 RepID=UPI001C4DF8F3|nr:glycosyltransferase family 4 protein [Ensifer adhaerens]MBW0365459.1 glycosyltransferase family 4 protein [Ensifer adhaerens]UCM22793.1 glycosyltransferase family 4 protein [Ensifer adhaerens]